MAILDSRIAVMASVVGIHQDENGAHRGTVFSYTGYNYTISSIDVMLAYRLNQAGGAGTATNIQCGVRDYFRAGVILGSSAEGDNLISATPVSTGELTTYEYYDSPAGAGSWITFVFDSSYEFTSALPYIFVLSLDVPTVIIGSPPYNTLPAWGTIQGTSDFRNKEDAPAVWEVYNNRSAIFRVNGTIIVPVPPGTPDDLTPFPPSCCSVVENDSFWQPGVWSGDDYTDPYWGSGYVATGGGRWGRNLVVAGHGLVYYEDYT